MIHPLTVRQVAIVALIARGLTNAEIGDALGYSRSTIRNELIRVYRIMGTPNRPAAVAELARGRVRLAS